MIIIYEKETIQWTDFKQFTCNREYYCLFTFEFEDKERSPALKAVNLSGEREWNWKHFMRFSIDMYTCVM